MIRDLVYITPNHDVNLGFQGLVGFWYSLGYSIPTPFFFYNENNSPYHAGLPKNWMII